MPSGKCGLQVMLPPDKRRSHRTDNFVNRAQWRVIQAIRRWVGGSAPVANLAIRTPSPAPNLKFRICYSVTGL